MEFVAIMHVVQLSIITRYAPAIHFSLVIHLFDASQYHRNLLQPIRQLIRVDLQARVVLSLSVELLGQAQHVVVYQIILGDHAIVDPSVQLTQTVAQILHV